MAALANTFREDITKLAKQVIFPNPVSCEWGNCSAWLSSWQALEKHSKMHCSGSKERPFECKFQRCATRSRMHDTLQDLIIHVLTSHLAKIHIPCPIKDCKQFIAQWHAQLPAHVAHVHPDINLDGLSYSSHQLKTLAMPTRPERWTAPEDLPCQSATYLITSPRVRRSKRGTQHKLSSSHAYQSVVMGRPGAPDTKECAPAPEGESDPFNDIVHSDIRLELEFCDWFEEMALEQPRLQLSRPFPIIDPPIPRRPPPHTIGWGPFSDKYRAMEKRGLIDGTGMWPED